MTQPPGADAGVEGPSRPDPAILRLVRALARQAAREDHEAERVAHAGDAPCPDEGGGRTACADPR